MKTSNGIALLNELNKPYSKELKNAVRQIAESIAKQLCQTCNVRPAVYKRVMFGDTHCEACVLTCLEGTFEPIIKETI